MDCSFVRFKPAAGLKSDGNRFAEFFPVFGCQIRRDDNFIIGQRTEAFEGFYVDIGSFAEIYRILDAGNVNTDLGLPPEHPDLFAVIAHTVSLTTFLSNTSKIVFRFGDTPVAPLRGEELTKFRGF